MRFPESELNDRTIWSSEAPCGPPAPRFALERPTPAFVEAALVEAPREVLREVIDVDCTHPPALELDDDDDGADIEVVDELEALPIDDASEPDDANVYDAYAAFVRTLEAVARAAGQAHVASRIEATLAIDPLAQAWRATLRGESSDLPGSLPLDEWAADTLARLMGSPPRSALLRRELRARGVAAFGLVEAA